MVVAWLRPRFVAVMLIGAIGGGGLAACSGEVEAVFPEVQGKRIQPRPIEERESIFGPGGVTLFGGKKDENAGGGGGIGVNSFLWRATLDTLSFMPLASADPFGGVIITDWYSPPDSADERVKVTAFILDRQLRADGIRVSVFRQTRGAGQDWLDAPVQPETVTALENAILTGARHLRIASLGETVE
ncbi:MAG: DUF3576 domain-containing protein [Alphaproteobacteria bacterium]|nr:DUF3576 domain-containing protein [Alphaproteobacteria bacterium]